MMFLKLALLNIRKHWKRSLVIIGSVFLSVLAMEFTAGMMKGMGANFINNMIDEDGHIQIHYQGFEERLNPFSLDYLIAGPDSIISQLPEEDLRSAEKMVTFGALLAKGEDFEEEDKPVENIAIMAHGIEPDTLFWKRVKEGMVAGDFLPQGEGLLLSTSIANLLDLKLGDGIIILVEDSLGSIWYEEIPITGLFRSASQDLDDNHIFVSHERAEVLLDIEGYTTEIRINLRDPELAEGYNESIAPLIERASGESKTWRTIHGTMLYFVEMVDLFIFIMNTFVIIVAATVITNSILMSIFKRLGEFGTLRAIGLKKSQLRNMILAEGSVMGFIGGILGSFLGILIVLYYQKNGFDMGAAAEFFGGGRLYYFSWYPYISLLNLVSGVFIAVLGSLYAAMVSTKMKLIDAIRLSLGGV